MAEIYLTTRVHLENSHTLSAYQDNGGYEPARTSLPEMSPDAIRDGVTVCGRGGRGGAGSLV